MKKKINKLCHIIGHSYPNTLEGNHGYCERCNAIVNQQVPESLIESIIETIQVLWSYSICYIFGHDWESDDYATPDSGYMGVTCKRCGMEHGTQLY